MKDGKGSVIESATDRGALTMSLQVLAEMMRRYCKKELADLSGSAGLDRNNG